MVWQLWRYMGPDWLFFRVKYAAQMRSGLLRRRMPAYPWNERPLSSWLKSGVPSEAHAYRTWRQRAGGHFFFAHLPSFPLEVPWDTRCAIEQADRLLSGTFRYFGHTDYNVGFPPDWHLNPTTGQRLPEKAHWTQISDFGQGDIKLVWEASRFGYVYTLVRAYAATRDERYPAAFWQLVEDWAAKNPPNTGPNWKCGQEAAFRLMAWCFGLYGFALAECSTSTRIAELAALVAAHAERIERNINYARSQKNNHAISEAVGLWSVGLLFPEFERSIHWRECGRRVIEKEVAHQIYDDGAYVQHSMNYHRVMLHDLLWAIRLGELNDHRLSEAVYQKFGRAVEFLYQLLNIESGEVPNYGANDGALVLPLSTCDYPDYRPVLQASHYLLTQKRLFETGPWDEDLLWLFGDNIFRSQVTRPCPVQASLSAPNGGYFSLRSSKSWAMIRCAKYRDRPSQADQLHFDLWWKGVNIACDAGTFLYSGDSPWNNGLAGTAAHNTVSVDNKNQMWKVSRFLWLDWANGDSSSVKISSHERLAYWQGTHDGYCRLHPPVHHRRHVFRLDSERWLVLDALESGQNHLYKLHWLLPDLEYTLDTEHNYLELHTPSGPYRIHFIGSSILPRMTRAATKSAAGWRSRYYNAKEPALSLCLSQTANFTHFWTLFSPPETTITFDNQRLRTEIQWANTSAKIEFARRDQVFSPISAVLSENGTKVDCISDV